MKFQSIILNTDDFDDYDDSGLGGLRCLFFDQDNDYDDNGSGPSVGGWAEMMCQSMRWTTKQSWYSLCDNCFQRRLDIRSEPVAIFG